MSKSESAMNTKKGATNAAPPDDASKDTMDEALKALVRKIGSQMEVLCKKNQCNEHENAFLRKENARFKEQLISIDHEFANFRQKRESEIETHSLQQQRTEARLNERISAMAKEKESTAVAFNAHIKAERNNFENVRAQKHSQDLKLRELLTSNDALCIQVQDAKRSNLDLAASAKAENRKMEQRIASLNADKVAKLCLIRSLEDELSTVRSRYEAIQTAMDAMIASTAKQIETHSFWTSNVDSHGDTRASELREHTDQRRLVEIDLFAKRIIALQTRQQTHSDKLEATHIRWRGKVEAERIKSADLSEQLRALQSVRDALLNENYRLLTDGDATKAELQLSRVTATAQQSFSEMKSGELEQRMLCLSDDLKRKTAQILKLESNEASAKKEVRVQLEAHRAEVTRLKLELQAVSQSSSELLQSSISGAIEQLRSVSDEYAMRSAAAAVDDKEQLVLSPKVLPRIVVDENEVDESPATADLSEGVVELTMQIVKVRSADDGAVDEEKDAISEADFDESSSAAASPGNTNIADSAIASISVEPKLQYSLPSPASSSDDSDALNPNDGGDKKAVHAYAQHLLG